MRKFMIHFHFLALLILVSVLTLHEFMIHFHFLASLILVSFLTLSWDWIIAKEHVDKLHTETSLIEQNSVMGITISLSLSLSHSLSLSLFSLFPSLCFSFLKINKFKFVLIMIK